MKFFKTPFLYVTPIFILGILLGELLTVSMQWLAIGVLVSAFLLFLTKAHKWLLLALFSLSFLLLGATLIQNLRFQQFEVSKGLHSRIGIVTEADPSDKMWKKHIVLIESEKKGANWNSIDQEVLIYSQQQLREGDIFLFRTQLEPIANSGNPGEFDAVAYWNSKNISSMGFLGSQDFTLLDYVSPNWFTQLFTSTRSYLARQIAESLPEKEASLANALLLGDKSKLSGETRESFGNAGAMHVLAISGLHVGIIMYLLFFVLQRMSRWVSRNAAVIITLLFLWIFAGVTGWSPSVIRAALMFSLLLLGQQWARSGSELNTLFFSALLILLINPLLLFDIGFQLSYGAMLGIFMFFEKVKQLVKVRNALLQKAWDGTALGISAQMFTIPLVLYHFHQFPNYFWLTNLGIMCLAGIILSFGLVFFALHYVPLVNVAIAVLLAWSLWSLVQFIEWVEFLPYGVAKGFNLSAYEVVLFVVVMLCILLFYRQKVVRYASIGILLLLVGGWQVNRYAASEKAEIVVFNSNSPVIAIKQEGKIRGFYMGKKERADRILNAYARVMPGQVQLDSLRLGTFSLNIDHKHIQLERINDGVILSVNGKKTLIRTRYKLPKFGFQKIIDMPYLESQKNFYNLSNGALRIKM